MTIPFKSLALGGLAAAMLLGPVNLADARDHRRHDRDGRRHYNYRHHDGRHYSRSRVYYVPSYRYHHHRHYYRYPYYSYAYPYGYYVRPGVTFSFGF